MCLRAESGYTTFLVVCAMCFLRQRWLSIDILEHALALPVGPMFETSLRLCT